MIRNFIETVDNFAVSQPEAIAYNYLGDLRSYRQLKEDSDSIAHYIDSILEADQSHVLVFGGQTYDMLATFFALSKSGHAFIPVDSHTVSERLLSIIDIAKPSLIIAIEPLPIEIEGQEIITLSEIEAAKEKKASYVLTHPVLDDDNYYIIFTSGTTGQPKGVQISHTNLLSFTNWMIEDDQFALPNSPQMLIQAPYSFDLSVMSWAPALALGGTLHVLPKEITADFKLLFKTLEDMPFGIWTSTPSFAEMALLSDDFCQEKMKNLTHFYFDGEELTVSTAQKLRTRFPDARIVNAYGPTEATVALSAIAIDDQIIKQSVRLPIGYTKEDSPTYVVDEQLNILPKGTLGEIVVTGPAVSKGYLNNPEKTEEAFFTLNGVQAYHTGDLGQFSEDNILLYSGRKDFQIKYAGYRIELEDISQQLNQSEYVEAAVAVPRYNEEHKVQNLLAYVVLKDGVRENFANDRQITKAIKQSVESHLMAYMMPSKFIFRQQLPLTANGKIDIKFLINEVNER
ncbi:D-alanine--poly(phosphoribitol) ligase subunit DltA [Streptococcus catagoni]|uniref:D-alanine--poly(phosphoribitol) ligase subunit DltA n=1 Tax=Streptococcus catagoni TaxID=2654874 RepID=UPI00140DE068|nr:D-alanine--poly(phosphoribitol) ligase subunit DltA [Streptococcus catagoni]